jgi:CRP-like cAMP-binding protein
MTIQIKFPTPERKYAGAKREENGVQSLSRLQNWQNAVAVGPLEDRHLRRFGITAPPHSYAPGVLVFNQGETAEDVYCIQSGLVKLCYLDAVGKEIIVGLRRSGSLLGLAAALLQQLHATTAETITRCILLRIPAQLLKNLLNVNPGFSAYVHDLTAKEITANLERLIDMATKSTRHNLLKLLSQIIVALKQTNGGNQQSIRIPMKQCEVARLLAVTPEHLNRTLRTLEDEGLVVRKRDAVIIPQVERLVSMLLDPPLTEPLRLKRAAGE